MALRSPDYWRAGYIAALLFVSYAYFLTDGGWNEASHIDLTRALAERHSIVIDAYHANSGDVAFFRGHYYSDKAPALSFAALPAYAIARKLIPERNPALPKRARYVATVATVSLSTALTGAAIYLLAVALGYGAAAGVFAALVFGLCTPIWGYSVVFWGHGPAGMLLLFAVIVASGLRVAGSFLRDWRLAALVGVLGGLATMTEYPAAVPAVAITMGAVYLVRSGGTGRMLRVLGGIAAGALPCALLLGWYEYEAFGSPFQTGYQHLTVFAGVMSTGYAGLTHPTLLNIARILYGHHRGLLPLSPVLIVAPIGLYLLVRRRESAYIAGLAAFTFIFYVLLNASYVVWDGGASIGPRQIGASLPLLCLGLIPVWARASRTQRILILMLTAYSFLAGAVSGMYSGQVFEPLHYPIGTLALRLVRGTHAPAYNWGNVIGLHGLATMIPLVVVWALLLIAWRRSETKRPRVKQPEIFIDVARESAA